VYNFNHKDHSTSPLTRPDPTVLKLGSYLSDIFGTQTHLTNYSENTCMSWAGQVFKNLSFMFWG